MRIRTPSFCRLTPVLLLASLIALAACSSEPSTEEEDAQAVDLMDVVDTASTDAIDTATSEDISGDAESDTLDTRVNADQTDDADDGSPDMDQETMDAGDTTDLADAMGPECESDKDCSDMGLLCDPLLQECVECLRDAHCDTDEHCRARLCVGYVPCTTSLDCVDVPSAPICDADIAECVECSADPDCDGDADCIDNTCVAFTPCTSSVDCGSDEVCDEVVGRCVNCLGDNDCGPSEHCIDSVCEPYIACDSDKDCTSAGMLCDTDIGECRACLDHAHCPDAYHCTTDGNCALDICASGQASCSGNAVVECNAVGDGFESPQDCGSEATCVRQGLDATCEPHICTPGSTCDGDTVVECSADGLTTISETDCTATGEVCFEGSCRLEVCEPSARYCDGDTIMACDADGASASAVGTCGDGQYCDDLTSPGTATCEDEVCTPDARFCQGADVMLCDAIGSSASLVTTCTSTEFCDDDGTGSASCEPRVCTPGETFCVSGEVRECDSDGGGSTVVTTCTSSQYCDDSGASAQCIAQVCVPDSTYCQGDEVRQCDSIGSMSTLLETCTSSEYCDTATATCEPVTCTPDSTFCQNDEVRQCSSDGSTSTLVTTCTSSQYCESGTCQAQVCTPDSTFCDGNDVRLCNSIGSDSTVVSSCPTAQYCDDATATCQDDVCPQGTSYCDAGNAWTCSADGSTATLLETCGSAEYCDASGGNATCEPQVCDPGQPACDGSVATTCNGDGSGYLSGGTDCALSGKVCVDGACERPTPVYRYSVGPCTYQDETHNLNTGTSESDCSGYDQYALGQLVDGRRGQDDYRVPSEYEWVGFEYVMQLDIDFDFGAAVQVGQVVVGMSNFDNYGVEQAEEIRVAFSDDGVSWTHADTYSVAAGTLELATPGTRADFRLELSNPSVHRYWRVTLVTDKNWTFIDEVELNHTCDPNQPACDGDVATTCNADGTGYTSGGTDCSLSGEVCADGACETQSSLGSTSSNPGDSCQQILDAGASTGDGLYWVDPDGSGSEPAVEAYCDMTTDGGGWTRIFGIVNSGGVETPVNGQSSLSMGLEEAASGTGHVLPSSLDAYRTSPGFAELRFECEKPSVGRRVHIATTDTAVLDYFTARTNTFPTATGSFTTKSDDTSVLSGMPAEWGYDGGSYRTNSWGHANAGVDERLWHHAFFIVTSNHWLLVPTRYECDDYNASGDGEWYIWVR